MSCILDQLIFLAIGAFISFSAKVFKIHPIPIMTEIMSVLMALGMIWLTRQMNSDFYSTPFSEQVRLVLLGYLPMRIIRWPKSKKDECSASRESRL